MTNKEYAAGLRQLAEVYERCEDVPQDKLTLFTRLNMRCDTKEQFVNTVRAFKGVAKGCLLGDKDDEVDTLTYIVDTIIPVSIIIDKEKVFKKNVLYKKIIPAKTVTYTIDERVKEVVEWEWEPVV